MSPPHYRIPKPSSEDGRRFEKMVRDLLISDFACNLALLGRRGQKQDGVDLLGSRHLPSGKEERLGVQCAVRAEKLEPSKISSDLIAADNKYPAFVVDRYGTSSPNKRRLDVLYFATSADRDAKTQTALDGLSIGRTEQGKSRLQILFWDEIEELLFKHQRVYAHFYPDVFSFAVEWHGRYRGQAALELGFKGNSLYGHEVLSLKNNRFDYIEFEDFRKTVDELVESRRRLSSAADTNDALSTLAAFVGEPGSPFSSYPDPACFVEGGIFPQWLNKVFCEQPPTERSFMYVGGLLAQWSWACQQQREMERRTQILSMSCDCTPNDKPLLSNLFRHLNQEFSKVNDPMDAQDWSYRFFTEWSKRLFLQARDAFVPLPDQPPHSLPESVESLI